MTNPKMKMLPSFFIISVFIAENWFAAAVETDTLTASKLSFVVDGSGKGCEFIDSHAFDKFANMTSLNLAENQLMAIPESVSWKLERLTYLNLSGNPISYAANDFAAYSRLRILDISNNPKLTKLDSNYLLGLTNLSSIRLGGNGCITEIKCDAFGNGTVRSRDSRAVYRNRTKPHLTSVRQRRSLWDGLEIRACSVNGTLNRLNIWKRGEVPTDNLSCGAATYNFRTITISMKINEFTKGWCCGGMNDVEEFLNHTFLAPTGLYFESTEISEIAKDTFKALPRLMLLNLRSSRIRDTKTIANLPLKLKFLSITKSSITVIKSDSFSILENLAVLNLMHNQITTIEARAFENNQNLRKLYLNDNPIFSIDKTSFIGLKALQILRLDGSKLTAITAGVFDLPQLEMFGVSFSKIVVIQPGALKSLSRLRMFDISGNPITHLKNGALFGLPKDGKCSVKIMATTMEVVEGGVFDEKV